MDFEKQMEFLLQNQATHDAKIGQLLDMQRVHSEMHRQNEDMLQRNHEMQARTQKMLADVVESIDSLARIAHVHEQRIDRLEDRP